MPPAARFRCLLALALIAPIGLVFAPGCGISTPPETIENPDTTAETVDANTSAPMPGETGSPADAAFADTSSVESTIAPETIEPEGAETGNVPSLVQPTDLAAASTAEMKAEDASAAGDANITLLPMNYEEYREKIATNPDAKFTIVDAWATWCGPCKENFPHLVEMHRKYADQGLNVASIAMEIDPTDPRTIEEAQAFLDEKGADFTNVLLTEPDFGGYEKFDIGTIPAVFLYDPNGKEVRRFTMDDPNNQFTYDEVEQVVTTLLKGEPLPDDAPGEVYQKRDDDGE